MQVSKKWQISNNGKTSKQRVVRSVVLASLLAGIAFVDHTKGFYISSAIAADAASASVESAKEPADAKNQNEINAVKKAFLTQIQKVSPSIEVDEINRASIAGLYQVVINTGDVFYVDASGSLFIAGELFELKDGKVANLTENFRAHSRVSSLNNIKADTAISFKPQGDVRAVLYAFTDVDCGYCRQFHAEVPALNAKGVEVRYLAWPRSGMQGDTASRMVSIWCADDKRDALTKAKQGVTIPEKSCANPVDDHFKLGLKLGVKGTPALFLADGRKLGGYRTAADLLRELKLQ